MLPNLSSGNSSFSGRKLNRRKYFSPREILMGNLSPMRKHPRKDECSHSSSNLSIGNLFATRKHSRKDDFFESRLAFGLMDYSLLIRSIIDIPSHQNSYHKTSHSESNMSEASDIAKSEVSEPFKPETSNLAKSEIKEIAKSDTSETLKSKSSDIAKSDLPKITSRRPVWEGAWMRIEEVNCLFPSRDGEDPKVCRLPSRELVLTSCRQ